MRRFAYVFAGLFMVASWAPAQTARQYYEELYKAGGLDRMADQYVCFDESPDFQNFFIFAKSDTYQQFFEDNHVKLPKGQAAALKKGFLVVRGYSKGTQLSSEEFYDKDGDSWVVSARIQNTPIRERLSITWATLRYRRSVEILSPSGALRSTVDRYGKCEVIAPDVRQNGN